MKMSCLGIKVMDGRGWRVRKLVYVVFFSSRRRHTRYWRDWSSDVCSSDLRASPDAPNPYTTPRRRPVGRRGVDAMIVIMQTGAGPAATDEVVRRIEAGGLGAHVFRGAERNVIAVLTSGDAAGAGQALVALQELLVNLPGVERVEGTVRPFQLASRDVLPGGTTFPIGPARLGAELLTIVGASRSRPAGELVELARAAKAAGADVFWAGR